MNNTTAGSKYLCFGYPLHGQVISLPSSIKSFAFHEETGNGGYNTPGFYKDYIPYKAKFWEFDRDVRVAVFANDIDRHWDEIANLPILPCDIPEKFGGFSIGTPLEIFYDKLIEMEIMESAYYKLEWRKKLMPFKLVLENIFPLKVSYNWTSMPTVFESGYDYFNFFKA